MAASRGSWPSSTAPTPGPTWHLALVSLRQTDQGERQVYLRLGSCNDKPHRAPPCLFLWRELVPIRGEQSWGRELHVVHPFPAEIPSRGRGHRAISTIPEMPRAAFTSARAGSRGCVCVSGCLWGPLCMHSVCLCWKRLGEQSYVPWEAFTLKATQKTGPGRENEIPWDRREG